MSLRPILWDVDIAATPARMTILFAGVPKRYITVRIRGDYTTQHGAYNAAQIQLREFTPDQLQLLAESSAPMAMAPDPEAMSATITKVEQEDRYAGVLHCPACCHPLGRGSSPAIGYLEQCPSCKRQLRVRFSPGTATVILWTD